MAEDAALMLRALLLCCDCVDTLAFWNSVLDSAIWARLGELFLLPQVYCCWYMYILDWVSYIYYFEFLFDY